MRGFKGAVGHRARWLAAFTLLLLSTTSVAALAETGYSGAPGAGASEGKPTESPDTSVSLPDADDVREGLEAAEREEADRARWLQSPEAIRQRKESRYAFADLSAAESQELLTRVFSGSLATLNSDPTRWLSDATIVKQLGQSGATVRKDGETLLLSGTVPFRATNEDGDLKKVDLGLEATPGGFEPANPATDLRIPLRVDEPIAIGNDGVEVTALGAAESGAMALGDKNLFYPDALGAAVDTDRLVSPVGAGVEIFDLLRSADSPEVFRFELDLPQGAELVADGYGGAKVLRGEEPIASIPFPHAVDAQGTVIPVDLKIEGSTIALHLAHREADLAYPILLDPAILTDWYNHSWANGHNLGFLDNGTWTANGNTAWVQTGTSCIPGGSCFWASHRGLYIGMQAGNHSPENFAQWRFTSANSNSYLAGAWINPFKKDHHGCTSQGQPIDYVGMWHNNGWIGNPVINQAAIYGYTNPNSWGTALIIGMSTANGVNTTCRRDLGVGGVAIWEDDWQHPSIDSVALNGAQNKWISDLANSSISVSARDEGLGVHWITMFQYGNTIIKTEGPCTGIAGSRCPTTRLWQQTFSGDSLQEGRRSVQITAADPTGKTSGSYETHVWVDKTSPTIELDGQFAEATEEDVSEQQGDKEVERLRLPVYRLDIKAEDGSLENDYTKRSGVKEMKVLLDGQEKEVWNAEGDCLQKTSCPMVKTYDLELSRLEGAKKYKLEVIAVDFVGKKETRETEFEYFPATGMKEEYVLQYFPLPDGQGDESSEEHPNRPELAVNVMNGNLVYRERDIDVEGPAVDLEVERYYNSMLPAAEDTEWGEGWTLGETPDLEPVDTGGSPAPDVARLRGRSGAIVNPIALPAETGQTEFIPELRSTLIKRSGGGFEMRDETGESPTSVVFDATGQTEALLTEGLAKVDYAYEGGELAEIAVEDPGTAAYPEGEPFEPAPTGPPVYAISLGSGGTGNGQYNHPADIAVAPDGDLWVVDMDNDRVQHFDSDGNYIGKFGTNGTGDGQFRRPVSIEVDEDGHIWVLDAMNQRMQKFNDKGEYLAKWGSYGTSNGKLHTPESFTLDAEGNFWVSDVANARIQKFTATGTFLKVTGTSGPGDLTVPMGIDTGPEGEVFVADWAQHRVVVFNAAGEYEGAFGTEGTGDGQFRNPIAVEVDTQGNVWVSDERNERIERFDLEGTYIDQFGSEGSGDGQMDPIPPMGIATDAKGGIWLTDSSNDRIQLWIQDAYRLAYADSFGSAGTGNGQFNQPADVAITPDGDVWVADANNHRVQHFDADGDYVGKFGTSGTGNGQFSKPVAIEVDAAGALWVLDSGNDRVQKFNDKGEYLTKWGSLGSANGKLDTPKGLAIDSEGNFWISDTYNDRIQKFTATGTFLKATGTSGPGDLTEPMGLDVGPDDEVLVAARPQHRVVVFNAAGEYENAFGSEGTGDGQFRNPAAVDVDAHGNVWVGDESNERIEQFDLDGEYVTQFGSEGSGDGEMELISPLGITTDGEGDVWLTDALNARVQRWEIPPAPPTAEELLEDDPEVQVEVANDLVTAVVGDEAGEHTYEHDGDFLVSHDGPLGETLYEEDEGRLSKVTLPNATWASIAYYADNRVQSVTVAPEGTNAKTTYFYYDDGPPRETVVDLPNDPNVTYDISADGSVFKSWNTEKPPIIDPSRTIWDARGKTDWLWAGNHELEVEARSTEGIARIEVIANGNQLVDELTCEQDQGDGDTECQKEKSLWVTHTNNHAPGHLYFDILVTDESENVASERFWVDIPEPPPPPAPGTPVVPTVEEIAEFREEYGLEVVFPVKDEFELADRINNLRGYWHSPDTPLGAVARASWERWGIPLRPEDVAEMEYREWLYDVNAARIDQWVEATNPSNYAGYYIDHRAGGVMRIGFLGNQAEQLANLETSLTLVGGSRLSVYPTPPTASYLTVRATAQSVLGALESNPALADLVVSVEDDEAGKATRVGTSHVVQVEGILDQILGANAPVTVEHEAGGGALLEGRYRNEGRMRAGDYINGTAYTPGGVASGFNKPCTAGFGAKAEKGHKPNGDPIWRLFLLTAGHCYTKIDQEVWRAPQDESQDFDDAGKSEVGRLARNALQYVELGGVRTDGAAIRIEQGGILPLAIWGWGGHTLPMGPSGKARKGNVVCYSGALSKNVSCGQIIARSTRWTGNGDGINLGGYWVKFPEGDRPVKGDSGSPVWNRYTGASIGLVSAGRPAGTYEETLVAPLLHPPNMPPDRVPGILHHPGMAPLQLMLGG